MTGHSSPAGEDHHVRSIIRDDFGRWKTGAVLPPSAGNRHCFEETRVRLALSLLLALAPTLALAGAGEDLDLRAHPIGATALAIFVIAYALVIAELL